MQERKDGWMEGGERGKEEGKGTKKAHCCVYLPESVFICFAVTELWLKVIVFGNNRGKKARSLYKSHITPIPFYYIYFLLVYFLNI